MKHKSGITNELRYNVNGICLELVSLESFVDDVYSKPEVRNPRAGHSPLAKSLAYTLCIGSFPKLRDRVMLSTYNLGWKLIYIVD